MTRSRHLEIVNHPYFKAGSRVVLSRAGRYFSIALNLVWATCVGYMFYLTSLAFWKGEITFRELCQYNKWPILFVLYLSTPYFLLSFHSTFRKLTKGLRWWKVSWRKIRSNHARAIASSKRSTYTPLDYGDREIRLLHIRPDLDDGEIEVLTSRVSLHDRPVYIALSYVWGVALAGCSIKIDGRSMLVTENVFELLKHLHRRVGKDANLPVWIDALSIDQQNPIERGQQVRLMTELYDRAHKVLIWLGPPNESTELALAKMCAVEALLYKSITQYIREEAQPHCKPQTSNGDEIEDFYNLIFPRARGPREETRKGVPTAGTEMDEYWAAIIRLVEDTKYFQRSWVVQEATSPSSLRTPRGNIEVILGRQMQTANFRNTLRTIPFLLNLAQGRPHVPNSKRVFGLQRFCTLATFRAQSSLAARFFSLWQTSQNRERLHWQLTVRNFVGAFRDLQAADPRDKIFASLPLVLPSNHHAFNPDYTLSVETVYAHFVQNCIKYEGNLNILCECNPANSNLASWIPDWRSPRQTNELGNRINTKQQLIYSTSGQSRPECTFQVGKDNVNPTHDYEIIERLPEEPLLSLRGFSIDTVVRLCQTFRSSTTFRRPEWESFIVSALPGYYRYTDEPLSHAYQRLLTADVSECDHFAGQWQLTSWTDLFLLILEKVEKDHRAWFNRQDVRRMPQSYSILNFMEKSESTRNWEIHKRKVQPDQTYQLMHRSEGSSNDNNSEDVTKCPPTYDEGRPDPEEDRLKVCNTISTIATNISRNTTQDTSQIPKSVVPDTKWGTAVTESLHGNPSHGQQPTVNSAGNTEPSSNVANQSNDLIPSCLLEATTDSTDKEFQEEQYRELLSYTTTNRALAVTDKGYMALVPQESQVGDAVVVLFGGAVPFILRSIKNETSEQDRQRSRQSSDCSSTPSQHGAEAENKWRLVGEAYVHGIMDGEAMRARDPQNDEVFVLA